MYIPDIFAINDSNELYAFIEQWNFGDLITTCNGDLFVNHVPFILDKEQSKLYGHFSLRNPQCDLLEIADDLLVVFRGAHCYVSPSWYVSKEMVPTWNFESVQVRGKAKLVTGDGLLAILTKLTNLHESQFESPWKIEKITEAKRKVLMQAIIGFEIEIVSIKGKSKLSQNRSDADKLGVIKGLRSQNDVMSSTIANKMDSILNS